MSRAVVLALVALAGCNQPHAVVTLTVDAVAGTTLSGLDHLTVRVTDTTRTPTRDAQPFEVSVAGGTIPPAQTVVMAFSDIDGSVAITVDAFGSDGQKRASGATTATVTPRKSTDASLGLVGVAPPADMSELADLSVNCAAMPPTTTAKFVLTRIDLPTQRLDWAYDLNGDGRLDNQYGNLIGALSGQALTPQADMTNAIASGSSIVLVAEHSSDPTFAADPCAQSELYDGQAQASPDFSGNGSFTIDGSVAPGRFAGVIGPGSNTPGGMDMATTTYASGFFSSAATVTATTSVDLTLPLAFGSGSTVRVPLVGGHIQYEYMTQNLIAGRINGAIQKAAVQSVLVPELATTFTTAINKMPCDSTCMQERSLFDTGGAANAACSGGTCQNPDGTCAVKNDLVVSPCEVATNGLIVNLLAPDVQLFDAQGNFHPDPANTTKDSLSVGVGFTAVRASF